MSKSSSFSLNNADTIALPYLQKPVKRQNRALFFPYKLRIIQSQPHQARKVKNQYFHSHFQIFF